MERETKKQEGPPTAPSYKAGSDMTLCSSRRVGSVPHLDSLCPWDHDLNTGGTSCRINGVTSKNILDQNSHSPKKQNAWIEGMPPTTALHCDETVSKFQKYLKIRNTCEPEERVSYDFIFIQHARVWSATVRNVMATTHSSVSVIKRVYHKPSSASSMDSVVGMVLNERAISQAASKNMALHLEERLERRLWENEDDNWALVSDDSEYCPASSFLSVAGMVYTAYTSHAYFLMF